MPRTIKNGQVQEHRTAKPSLPTLDSLVNDEQKQIEINAENVNPQLLRTTSLSKVSIDASSLAEIVSIPTSLSSNSKPDTDTETETETKLLETDKTLMKHTVAQLRKMLSSQVI